MMNRRRILPFVPLCLCAFVPFLLTSCHSTPSLQQTSEQSDDAPLQIFVTYGYPAVLGGLLLETYLIFLGAEQTGTGRWGYAGSEGVLPFDLTIDNSAEGFSRALTTEDAVVIFFGHSNFGLGIAFDPRLDHSAVSHIRSIDDFFNIGAPEVAVNIRFLKETHAYPNIEIRESDIVDHPTNYTVPGLGLEKHANIDGVAPGETFRYLRGEGYDRYHFMADRGAGVFFPSLVVKGGAADLPSPLRYRTLFYHGCFSGHYYGEIFNRGVFFYTLENAYTPTEWVFLDGVIREQPHDEIKDRLNAMQNVYDYHVF